MADDTQKKAPAKPRASKVEDDVMTPMPVAVTAQENKVVDNDGAEAHVVEPEVTKDQVAAQVVQPREGDSDKVNVHETAVLMDRVITDPSSPLAVQVPPEGRGDASLPIHRLARGTVEDVFKRDASKADDS